MYTECLWLILLISCFELPAATLSIHGDKSQFFQYDSISLMCAAKTSGWTLRKINSSKTFPSCDGNCTLLDAMPSDTGIYMCQSEHGRCSNTVSITVTGTACAFCLITRWSMRSMKLSNNIHLKISPIHRRPVSTSLVYCLHSHLDKQEKVFQLYNYFWLFKDIIKCRT